ncbi:MAG: AAA family ATPase [Alphaproteobacteria bacterium]|nr:AAA family ATPase [Alphaproteobacteria bacterium]
MTSPPPASTRPAAPPQGSDRPPTADGARAGTPQLPRPVVEELDHLARIRRNLAENPEGPGASEVAVVEEILSIQRDLPAARNDDKPALFQQLEHLQARLDQVRAGRPTEQVDPESPYFGHLGLLEDGRRRDIFIGRATRLGEGLRIVDWRNAPISQMFYRYEEGDDFEEEMAGRERVGRVVARRTVHIQAGELQRVGSAAGTWLREEEGWRELARSSTHLAGGEGTALRAGRAADGQAGSHLGSGQRHRADKHLPDIAALIDPDQFALITGQDSGVVVLRGSAGSGKTTVALHRIAYLTYDDPRRFAPERILVVVWGRAMRDYVGHVLPALGVDGVRVTTWDSWSKKQVRRHFGAILPTVWADDTPEPVVRIKLHPAVSELLARHIRATPGPARPDQVLEDWASVLTDGPAIARAMGDAISASALDKAVHWITEQSNALLAHAAGDSDADARLDAEDAALLLRAWQLRIGPLSHKGRTLRNSHLVLDEVQDFSPVEVQVLLDTTDEKRCVTLAGDVRQHISKEAGFSSWSEFLDRIGVPSQALATLQVSYRSTHEITSFALQVLHDDDEPTPRTTRSGPPVELFQFSDHGACVAFLAEELRRLILAEPLANVALLTPDPDLSLTYFEGLQRAEVEGVRLVEEQAFAFAPGIDVVEASEVKGLEFDYVVVVDASARWWPDSPHHRRLMHVAATRAVHQLWLTCVGTPSSILPRAQRGR